jgi:hypothetical protein
MVSLARATILCSSICVCTNAGDARLGAACRPARRALRDARHTFCKRALRCGVGRHDVRIFVVAVFRPFPYALKTR